MAMLQKYMSFWTNYTNTWSSRICFYQTSSSYMHCYKILASQLMEGNHHWIRQMYINGFLGKPAPTEFWKTNDHNLYQDIERVIPYTCSKTAFLGFYRLNFAGCAWDFFLGDSPIKTECRFKVPSLKLTVRTWKWMIGILVSFWDCLFSGANC